MIRIVFAFAFAISVALGGAIAQQGTIAYSLAVGGISGLGTGVATALGTNVGSAGAFVTFNGALGSPSSVGTLPALTLGGTISGGAQAINNLTTLAATTSVTTPLHVGGSSATQVSELRTTSATATDLNAFVKVTGGNNGATALAWFGSIGGGYAGMWMRNATPTSLNYVLAVDSTSSDLGTYLNAPSGGTINFNVNGATVATVNTTGGLTATLTNVASTSAICYNTSTKLFTYNSTVGTCTVSGAHFKNLGEAITASQAQIGIDVLRVNAWTYKPEYQLDTGQPHVGLIADDVEKMDSRCVVYKDGKVQDYDQRCVLAYLVAVVQEQKREIAGLKAR